MPGKSFIDFIDDCTTEAEKHPGGVSPKAEQFVNMLSKPGQTPEELYTFFNNLGVDVIKGDCERLLKAAKAAQGPTPTGFQPKY
ncbi:MAG: hypothetical protein ACLP5H_32690 [Desulfomonilaceae bacterium]